MSNKPDLQIKDREMLHNKVCRILRTSILKGDFKPGEKLIQTELAEMIGVSRMPIREALRTLEIEGLIALEPHKGAIVRTLKKEDIEEIYELRSILEPLALRKSIRYFENEDLNELKKIHSMMKETKDKEEYIELNAKFHHLLVFKCHSPRLLDFIKMTSRGFAQDTPQIIPNQIYKSNEEHESILKAIWDTKAKKASDCLQQHIQRTGNELISVLETKKFS